MRNDELEDYLSKYKVKPPKEPKSARPKPKKKIDDLIDYEKDLFELTLAKFAPEEPAQGIKHKPVRRVRVFEHHGDQNGRITNIPHIAKKLKECDRIRTDHLNVNADVHAELLASEHRLRLVRRGISLASVLKNEQHQPHQIVEPEKRFDGINDAIRKIPTKYSGIPPSRKIQFIYPVTSKTPERVDLVSKINIAAPQKEKLRKIKQGTSGIQLQYHNEMIQHLNHVNERRMRSTEQFFDDMSRYGYEVAQRKAKRAAQRSRLRVMCKEEWWDDFMKEVSRNPKLPDESDEVPEMKITRAEEKFIERLARHPNYSINEFVDLVHEMDLRQARLRTKDRCRKWLDWINERCGIVDKMTLKLMIDEKNNIIRKARAEMS